MVEPTMKCLLNWPNLYLQSPLKEWLSKFPSPPKSEWIWLSPNNDDHILPKAGWWRVVSFPVLSCNGQKDWNRISKGAKCGDKIIRCRFRCRIRCFVRVKQVHICTFPWWEWGRTRPEVRGTRWGSCVAGSPFQFFFFKFANSRLS